ncbi:kinesin-like protein Klp8 [Phlyctochytrium bullatum]|nr:kinesin-like protein Klp8 [Phlyctochytrium bullatum]
MSSSVKLTRPPFFHFTLPHRIYSNALRQTPSHQTTSRQVYVRVRPFNSKEQSRNSTCILRSHRPSNVTHITIFRPGPASTSAVVPASPATTLRPSSPNPGTLPPRPRTPTDGTAHALAPPGAAAAPAKRRASFSGPDAAAAEAASDGVGLDPKTFAFDRVFWSFGGGDGVRDSQEEVYETVRGDILDHAFEGFNVCLFAYGQTGSGKSYSMMGYGAEKGIIPRACEELFNRIEENKDPNIRFEVMVSYIEIYNEKVRDLLNPSNSGNLRVREHPTLGPYVEDLSKLLVRSFADVERAMDLGNKARTVAATNMNETSSRSHAVFTVILTQTRRDTAATPTSTVTSPTTTSDSLPSQPGAASGTQRVSRISLVDLAGSERADATGARGQRLKEGANINRSLTTLGKVISALADLSSGGGGGEPKGDDRAGASAAGQPPASRRSVGQRRSRVLEPFIPYRDSVLTWLLKDCLGGNSKTIMLAALSPVDASYDETLSTLRYAERAKRIVNRAVVNEEDVGGNAGAKVVRELKDEIGRLRARLAAFEGPGGPAPAVPLPLGVGAASVMGVAMPLQGIVQPGAASAPGAALADGSDFAAAAKAAVTAADFESLKEQLEASEKLVAELTQSYEEKLRRTLEIERERDRALQDLGLNMVASRPSSTLSMQSSQYQLHRRSLAESTDILTSGASAGGYSPNPLSPVSTTSAGGAGPGVGGGGSTTLTTVGLRVPKTVAHLINLNDDPRMNECLLYRLPAPGLHRVGSDPAVCSIVLTGDGILADHACFECVMAGEEEGREGKESAGDGSAAAEQRPEKALVGKQILTEPEGQPQDGKSKDPESVAPSRRSSWSFSGEGLPVGADASRRTSRTSASVGPGVPGTPGGSDAHVVIFLHPAPGAAVTVNGRAVHAPLRLWSGCKVAFGTSGGHTFRFSNPLDPVPATPLAESVVEVGAGLKEKPVTPPNLMAPWYGDTRTQSSAPSQSGSAEPTSPSSVYPGSSVTSPPHPIAPSHPYVAPGRSMRVATGPYVVSPYPIDPRWMHYPFPGYAYPHPGHPGSNPSSPPASAFYYPVAHPSPPIPHQQLVGGPVAATLPPNAGAVGGAWESAFATAGRDDDGTAGGMPSRGGTPLSHASGPNGRSATPSSSGASTRGGGAGGTGYLADAPVGELRKKGPPVLKERVSWAHIPSADGAEAIEQAGLRRPSVKVRSARGLGALQAPLRWTERQRELAAGACARWLRRGYVALAEEITNSAALLKEANVIAKELRKDVHFDLILAPADEPLNPLSFWELGQHGTAGIEPSLSPTTPEARSNRKSILRGMLSHRPRLLVRVLNGRDNAIFNIPLSTLRKRLPAMKAEYEITDLATNFYMSNRRQDSSESVFYSPDPNFPSTKPTASASRIHNEALQHPSAAVAPWFDRIGVSYISLRNILLGIPRESCVPVFAGIMNRDRVVGHLRVVITPISSHPPEIPYDTHNEDETNSDASAQSDTKVDDSASDGGSSANRMAEQGYLVEGGTLVLEVAVIELSGIKESQYTQVHTQFRLSEVGLGCDSNVRRLDVGLQSEGHEIVQHLPPPTLFSHLADDDAEIEQEKDSSLEDPPSESQNGVGDGALKDRIFATDPMSNFADTPVRWEFSQTIVLSVTKDFTRTIEGGLMKFEIFGRRVRPVISMIDTVYRHGGEEDLLVEQKGHDDGNEGAEVATQQHKSDVPPNVALDLKGRLPPKSGGLSEGSHFLLAQLQILELSSATGDFKAVPVQAGSSAPSVLWATRGRGEKDKDEENDIFWLRQGLQRRLTLRLSHTSGTSGFPWRRLVYLRLGRIQRHDIRTGLAMEDEDSTVVDLTVPATSVTAVNLNDGRSFIEVSAAWDSSVHNNTFLNRSSRQWRLHMTLEFGIEVLEQHSVPPLRLSGVRKQHRILEFAFPFEILMHDRDSKVRASTQLMEFVANTSMGLFSTTRFLPRARAGLENPVDALLAPDYIRGEENLGLWKPRTYALVQDYIACKMRMAAWGDVELARARIEEEYRDIIFIPPTGEAERDISSSIVDDGHDDSKSETSVRQNANPGSHKV